MNHAQHRFIQMSNTRLILPSDSMAYRVLSAAVQHCIRLVESLRGLLDDVTGTPEARQ